MAGEGCRVSVPPTGTAGTLQDTFDVDVGWLSLTPPIEAIKGKIGDSVGASKIHNGIQKSVIQLVL